MKLSLSHKNRKLLTSIKKGNKKTPKEKKHKKAKQLVHSSWFKREETFNCEESNFLTSKERFVALQRKDSKIVVLLDN